MQRPERAMVRFGEQHIGAAVAAVALSFCIHAALLLVLTRLDFGVSFLPPQVRRLRERVRPMRVEEVRIGTAERVTGVRPEGEGAVAPAADASAGVDDLAGSADQGLLEPPILPAETLEGETGSLAEPSAVPERNEWEPRQDILMIEDRIAAAEIPELERRMIPQIDRVQRAEDRIPDVDLDAVKEDAGRPSGGPGPDLPRAEIEKTARGATGVSDEVPVMPGTGLTATVAGRFAEEPEEISTVRPIDRFLQARIFAYAPRREPRHLYFRIDIERAGPEILPVLPKDVILIQDCSASMAEQRLHFCRDGLIRCLQGIWEGDRFNVVSFREEAQSCFTDWTAPEPESLGRAEAFIQQMASSGNTDIFGSMKHLLAFDRTPGRPVVALLVTDGRPTTGLVDSSEIIGEFSRANDGRLSVFAMGTVQTANAYLLDLLSYCNRGSAFVVTSGRWDIPDAMVRLMREVGRPVLSDLRFRFGSGSACEVYPVLTSNLYLDRPLAIYGRCPRDAGRVVFQAVGEAGSAKCDMVFDLRIQPGTGDSQIRLTWAQQKIYHLIGQYARRKDASLLDSIRDTARRYRVDVPYRGRF